VRRSDGRLPRSRRPCGADVDPLAGIVVAVDGEQHLGLDLAEAVEHARDAEIGRAGGPDGTQAGRRQHADHGLGHVGQVAGDPVALAHALGGEAAARRALHGRGLVPFRGDERRHPPARRRLGRARRGRGRRGHAPLPDRLPAQRLRAGLHAALAGAPRAGRPQDAAAAHALLARRCRPDRHADVVLRRRLPAAGRGGGAELHGAALRHRRRGHRPRRGGARPALDRHGRRLPRRPHHPAARVMSSSPR
jgi:hypothetical protein